MDDEHGHNKNENANPIHIVDGQKVVILVRLQVTPSSNQLGQSTPTVVHGPSSGEEICRLN